MIAERLRKRLSIVIPTWNRKDLALSCLRSLEKQTFKNFETIVVDDGSTDDTAEAVDQEFPEARVVRLPRNSGFAAAANAGIRRATSGLILLLNNDITVEPDFLEKLLQAADSSNAAMFAPLLLWRDDPKVIYSAGDRQLASGRPESVGFRRPREGFAFPRTIFGVSAAAGLYRREVFDRVGLLDEHFVAYFEDSDLSFRARLAGFEAEFVEDAVGCHMGSASIGGREWWRTRQCYRNHALLVLKNMPLELIRRNARVILAERIHQTRRLFSAARAERGAVWAAGVLGTTWLSILRQLPHALRERHRIQRTREIELGKLEELVSR